MSVRSVLQIVAAAMGLALACGGTLSTHALAQDGGKSPQQLERQLQKRVSLTWQGQQLDEALRRLEATAEVPIWLDRRVDPRGAVDLSAQEQSVDEVLQKLAASRGCRATQYRGVVYFGPAQSAGELMTLSVLARQGVASAPRAARQQWLTTEAWSCPRLSEPRQLVRELVESTGGRLAGDEAVPHDLWPARELPPMAAIDVIVLLLAGFDLTAELSSDGSTLKVVPVSRPVHVTQQHAIPAARRQAVEAALQEMPTAHVDRRGARLTLSARVEEHEHVARLINSRVGEGASPAASREAPRQATERRFTLRIENQPVGRVIDQLAAQLKLTVEWDDSLVAGPTDARKAPISCNVRQTDLDELLKAILSPAGLAADREGQHVRIIPIEPG